MNECLDIFLNYQLLKGNSPATIEDYNIIISRFINFTGNIPVDSLTANLVNNYNIFLRSNLKPVSVRTYIKHIKVFCNYLIKSRYVSFNIDDIIVPKVNKTIVDVLSAYEISRLLGCFNKNDFFTIRNKAMILLMLYCGLRASEVIRLNYKNVFIDSMYIKVIGKGNKERVVPLGDISMQALKQYMLGYILGDCEYIFTSSSGSPLERSVYKKMFCKLCKQSGIERLHPHLLRHTFATNFLLYGKGDIYQLSMILGHTDVRTTEIYLHYANYYKFMEQKKPYSYIDDLVKNQTT